MLILPGAEGAVVSPSEAAELEACDEEFALEITLAELEMVRLDVELVLLALELVLLVITELALLAELVLIVLLAKLVELELKDVEIDEGVELADEFDC